MVDDQTRRETLQLLALAGIAAGVGYGTRPKPSGEGVIPPGGTRNVPGAAGHIVLADSYGAIADSWNKNPTLAIIDGSGNHHLFGDGEVVVTIGDIDVQLGQPSKADAEAAVDSQPTIAITATGNTWLFNGGQLVQAGSDLVVQVGADTLSAAREAVDTYPTWATTDTGNAYLISS